MARHVYDKHFVMEFWILVRNLELAQEQLRDAYDDYTKFGIPQKHHSVKLLVR